MPPEAAFCFFFHAEDGIRALYVTGVQTCALPIYCRQRGGGERGPDRHPLAGRKLPGRRRVVETPGEHGVGDRQQRRRSEERRVGKELRGRRPTIPLIT